MNAPTRELRPPQFRLSTLMLLMALVGIVFALNDLLGSYGTFWLVIFVLAVAAHVAGNALGMRLRQQAAAEERPGEPPAAIARPRQTDYAPPTRLSRRDSLGWPILAATAAGSLTGALLGAGWVLASLSRHATLANLTVASLAFGILGGIWTFLAVGFVQVTWGALRHAQRGDSPPRP